MGRTGAPDTHVLTPSTAMLAALGHQWAPTIGHAAFGRGEMCLEQTLHWPRIARVILNGLWMAGRLGTAPGPTDAATQGSQNPCVANFLEFKGKQGSA